MTNKEVKGDGGIIGLTQSKAALERWLTAGSEINRILRIHEDAFHCSVHESANHHHEDTAAFQEKFVKDVMELKSVILETGNPFLERSQDLIALVTGVVAPKQAAENVLKAEAMGKEQYKEYCEERLHGGTSIFNNIARNNLQLFKLAKVRKRNKKVNDLKHDCSLFSRLFITTNGSGRDMDMEEFFSHENQPHPPAISDNGELYTGKKSDLLECFEQLSPALYISPNCSASIQDGMVMVNMLVPDKDKQKTFGD